MKLVKKLVVLACVIGLFPALSACKKAPPQTSDEASTPTPEQATQKKAEKLEKTAPKKTEDKPVTNMFGGVAYLGEPALPVTAALVKAGGGAENFSFAKALVAMLGQKTVDAEMAKLTEQYGKKDVETFITGMDFAVKDALKRATEAGIKLPPPADLSGTELAETLVKAGTTPDGTWWSGYLFDKALSHELHNQVMEDINKQVSTKVDLLTHKILNQAMYDVAQALGHKDVKLASLH